MIDESNVPKQQDSGRLILHRLWSVPIEDLSLHNMIQYDRHARPCKSDYTIRKTLIRFKESHIGRARALEEANAKLQSCINLSSFTFFFFV